MKTQRLYFIYTSFSYCFISFSAVYTKTMRTIENGKNQWKSVVCVFKSFHFGDRFQKLSIVDKFAGFNENDIKTYSCRRGLIRFNFTEVFVMLFLYLLFSFIFCFYRV